MKKAIVAELTNRQESEIASADKWASVIFVKFTSGRPTFVSLKKYNEMASKIEIRLTCSRRRRQCSAWLAQITGKSEQYRFERQFLEASDIEWGRRGMDAATFEIVQPGFYHDSDDDYSVVEMIDGSLEQRYCSKDEIEWLLKQRQHGREKVAA